MLVSMGHSQGLGTVISIHTIYEPTCKLCQIYENLQVWYVEIMQYLIKQNTTI
jgi:hypothetical protein